MEIQDLKNNREVILEQMSFIGVNKSMNKEFMQTMKDFVELDLNEDEDIISFVNQIYGSNKRKWQGKSENFSLRETIGKIEEAEGNTFKKWCPLRKEYV